MSTNPLPFRRSAEINIGLTGAINRSYNGKGVSALEHLADVARDLPDEHAAAEYIRENLDEDTAECLVDADPARFRFHCRHVQQLLDVPGEPHFVIGGDL